MEGLQFQQAVALTCVQEQQLLDWRAVHWHTAARLSCRAIMASLLSDSLSAMGESASISAPESEAQYVPDLALQPQALQRAHQRILTGRCESR